jgi:hypothetical protein
LQIKIVGRNNSSNSDDASNPTNTNRYLRGSPIHAQLFFAAPSPPPPPPLLLLPLSHRQVFLRWARCCHAVAAAANRWTEMQLGRHADDAQDAPFSKRILPC